MEESRVRQLPKIELHCHLDGRFDQPLYAPLLKNKTFHYPKTNKP